MKALLGIGAGGVALISMLLFGGGAVAAACTSPTSETTVDVKNIKVPENAKEWAAIATQETNGRIPANFFLGMFYYESNFTPDVFANDMNGGTWGLCQINASNWHSLTGGNWNNPNIKDPKVHAKYCGKLEAQNLNYVENWLKRHPNSSFHNVPKWKLIVACHNAGCGSLDWGGYDHLPAVTKRSIERMAPFMTGADVSTSNNSNAGNSGNAGNTGNVDDAIRAAFCPSVQKANPNAAGVFVPTGTKADDVVAYALTFQGVPYVWGGTTPKGFDCSGLVQYSFAHFGIKLPRIDTAQCAAGTRVPKADARAGDLVCFGGHVGIYLGAGKMVHAPQPGMTVEISKVWGNPYYSRIIP